MSESCSYPPINFQITNSLAWADYVVIGCCLLISTSIGIYFAYKDRKKAEDLENYLMAGRSLPAFPVAVSLTSSFISSVTVLGTPSEFYTYGTMFFFYCLTFVLVAVLVANFIVPVFYHLKIRSTYQYLEDRYQNKSIRYIATFVYMVVTILYNGIVVYSPALALQQIAGLSLYVGTVIMMLVCVFYTFLGGLKAVVWTDTFQVFVMVGGFLGFICRAGFHDFEGGFNEIFRIADDGGRMIADFRPDPTIRHTFWSIVPAGLCGIWGSVAATNQAQIQRYLSCKSEQTAKNALYLQSIFASIVGMLLPGIAGLCMYAYFHECDPVKAGWVSASDQLLTYLDTFVLRDLPGLTGLYIAGVFSGTLSTTSSGLNSLTTVVLDDIISPIVQNHPKIQNSFLGNNMIMSKILVIFFGLVIYATALIAPLIGDQVLSAAININTAWGAPLLGLFVFTIFVPFAEKWGANLGILVGLGFTNWWFIGSLFYKPPAEKIMKLELSTEGCIFPNQTVTDITPIVDTTTILPDLEPEESKIVAEKFYWITYGFQGVIGVFSTLIVATTISFFVSGCGKKKDHYPVDEKYKNEGYDSENDL